MFNLIEKLFAKKEIQDYSEQRARLKKIQGQEAPSSQSDSLLRVKHQTAAPERSLVRADRIDMESRMAMVAGMTGLSVSANQVENEAKHGLAATNNFKNWLSGDNQGLMEV